MTTEQQADSRSRIRSRGDLCREQGVTDHARSRSPRRAFKCTWDAIGKCAPPFVCGGEEQLIDPAQPQQIAGART